MMCVVLLTEEKNNLSWKDIDEEFYFYISSFLFLLQRLWFSWSSTLPPRASSSHNISFVYEEYTFLSFILQFSFLPIPASHDYTNYVVTLIFNHRKPNISFCSSVGRVYET
jgi:hypothetical protein